MRIDRPILLAGMMLVLAGCDKPKPQVIPVPPNSNTNSDLQAVSTMVLPDPNTPSNPQVVATQFPRFDFPPTPPQEESTALPLSTETPKPTQTPNPQEQFDELMRSEEIKTVAAGMVQPTADYLSTIPIKEQLAGFPSELVNSAVMLRLLYKYPNSEDDLSFPNYMSATLVGIDYERGIVYGVTAAHGFVESQGYVLVGADFKFPQQTEGKSIIYEGLDDLGVTLGKVAYAADHDSDIAVIGFKVDDPSFFEKHVIGISSIDENYVATAGDQLYAIPMPSAAANNNFLLPQAIEIGVNAVQRNGGIYLFDVDPHGSSGAAIVVVNRETGEVRLVGVASYINYRSSGLAYGPNSDQNNIPVRVLGTYYFPPAGFQKLLGEMIEEMEK